MPFDQPKGPNKYAEPRTANQAAAATKTCKYLGKIFYEGDKICYRGGEWRCAEGSWVDTGRSCQN